MSASDPRYCSLDHMTPTHGPGATCPECGVALTVDAPFRASDPRWGKVRWYLAERDDVTGCKATLRSLQADYEAMVEGLERFARHDDGDCPDPETCYFAANDDTRALLRRVHRALRC